MKQIQLLDLVALVRAYPNSKLLQGQVGTVVEVYEPGVFEVEFNDRQGRLHALETFTADDLLLLHHY